MPDGLPKELEKYKWKKGSSPNPGGYPKELGPLIAKTRNTKINVLTTILDYSALKLDELSDVLTNPNSTAIQVAVARLYSKSISGSERHLQILLDRLIGPVPKQIDIATGDEKSPVSAIINQLDPEKLSEFVINYRKRIEEKCQSSQNLQEHSQELQLASSPQESVTE